MNKFTRAIAQASERMFNALTTDEPRRRKREETISKEAARIRQRNAWRNLEPIVINSRYHVTPNPKFNINETLISSTDLNHVMQWCELKLNQVLTITGANLEELYVWNTDYRSPQLVVRYQILGGGYQVEVSQHYHEQT